jgi:hypothetical protein
MGLENAPGRWRKNSIWEGRQAACYPVTGRGLGRFQFFTFHLLQLQPASSLSRILSLAMSTVAASFAGLPTHITWHWLGDNVRTYPLFFTYRPLQGWVPYAKATSDKLEADYLQLLAKGKKATAKDKRVQVDPERFLDFTWYPPLFAEAR